MLVRIFFSVLLFVCFSNSLLAETYTREYTYVALSVDDESSSRIIAADQIRTLLLQKIASHIKQTIKISEHGSVNSYAKRDVEAVIANLKKINILEEKWSVEGYYIKAEVEADTRPVLDVLEDYRKDQSNKSRQLLKALKLNEQALQRSREKIARLNREIALSKKDTLNKKLLAEYRTEVDKLSTESVFAEGFEYYQQGEYKKAKNDFRKIAEQGNAVAQQLLGSIYMSGQGVEQDYATAIYWFQQAAEQGETIAQYYLGVSYLDGNGVEQDTAKAIKWLHKSAEQGDHLAQYQLGSMYFEGLGVDKKYFMAAHWYQKSADQGYAIAQYALGNMYADGKGVVKNKDEAIYWYRKAAEQGLDEAVNMLMKLDSNDEI